MVNGGAYATEAWGLASLWPHRARL